MHSEKNFIITPEELALIDELFPKGLVAVDIETTGLSPLVDKIIELSAVKIDSTGVSFFDQLVHPEILIPEHTIAIHGITDQMVQGKPRIEDVLPDFFRFVGEADFVAHNAKFDLGFIIFNWLKAQGNLDAHEVFCSCQLSRATFENALNHKLGNLVKELDIPLANHHRALDDAFACLKIFLRSLLISKEKNLNWKDSARLFNVLDFSQNQDEELPDHLEGLARRVKEGRVIEIRYRGGTVKNEFRPVRLVGLLNTPEGNILYAHCLISNMHKSFFLNKIIDFKDAKAEDITRWFESIRKKKEEQKL